MLITSLRFIIIRGRLRRKQHIGENGTLGVRTLSLSLLIPSITPSGLHPAAIAFPPFPLLF